MTFLNFNAPIVPLSWLGATPGFEPVQIAGPRLSRVSLPWLGRRHNNRAAHMTLVLDWPRTMRGTTRHRSAAFRAVRHWVVSMLSAVPSSHPGQRGRDTTWLVALVGQYAFSAGALASCPQRLPLLRGWLLRNPKRGPSKMPCSLFRLRPRRLLAESQDVWHSGASVSPGALSHRPISRGPSLTGGPCDCVPEFAGEAGRQAIRLRQ